MNTPALTLTRRTVLKSSVLALIASSLPQLGRAQSVPGKRKIVVTIDDGPASGGGRELAPFLRIAEALRDSFVAEKVPAIMFINERQLHVDGQRDARVEVLNRWLDAGLELGNHTYSHPNLGSVTLEAYCDDVIKGEVITRPLLESRGKKLVWFRYPFLASGSGATASAVEEFLTRRGYRIAPVTVDYHDYSFAGAYARHVRSGDQAKAEEHFGTVMAALDAAFARSEARSKEVLGYELPQVLLIHCNEMNALTLPRTLQRIRERGYEFISLDDALDDPAYKITGLRPGAMGGGGYLNSVAAARRPADER